MKKTKYSIRKSGVPYRIPDDDKELEDPCKHDWSQQQRDGSTKCKLCDTKLINDVICIKK